MFAVLGAAAEEDVGCDACILSVVGVDDGGCVGLLVPTVGCQLGSDGPDRLDGSTACFWFSMRKLDGGTIVSNILCGTRTLGPSILCGAYTLGSRRVWWAITLGCPLVSAVTGSVRRVGIRYVGGGADDGADGGADGGTGIRCAAALGYCGLVVSTDIFVWTVVGRRD